MGANGHRIADPRESNEKAAEIGKEIYSTRGLEDRFD